VIGLVISIEFVIISKEQKVWNNQETFSFLYRPIKSTFRTHISFKIEFFYKASQELVDSKYF